MFLGEYFDSYENIEKMQDLRKLTEENNRLKEELQKIKLEQDFSIFQSLFVDNYSIMMLIDPDSGQIVEANHAACKFYGFSCEVLTQMYIQDINTLSDKEIKQEIACAKSKNRNYFHFKHKLASKEIRDVEVYTGTIDYKQKQVLFSIIHDITTRKEMELTLIQKNQELQTSEEEIRATNEELIATTDALKENTNKLLLEKKKTGKSEKKFRKLFEKSGDAILIIKNNTFVDCNQAAVQMLGYDTKDEILNKTPSDLSPEKQPDGCLSSSMQDEMVELAEQNGTHRFEWIHRKKNGETFPVEVLLTIISKKKKKKIIHTVWRDITERKKAENEVLEQNKAYEILNDQLFVAKIKAEESDKLKTEFLSNMSHEIRTPMNGIKGFAQLLNNPDLTDGKRQNFIDIIITSSNQLMLIIEDIIEISKLETKEVESIEKDVCLNDLLFKLFSIFDMKAKENKTPLYLRKGLPDIESILLTDEAKLNKIISNLLGNALKFTSEGFIEFGYQLIEQSSGSEMEQMIQIYVKDSGIGIHPDKQEIIFKRFSQEEKELTRKFGGLGLGLSIAKENAELLGGDISLESEKGKGTTFYVTIPYQPMITKTKTNEFGRKIKRYQILITEDEEVNSIFLEILLENLDLDFQILHAKNGVEAVEMCKKHSDIDLVLMDLKMPIMNGYEATEAIRAFRKDLIIIAQTAYSSVVDKEKALAVGCNAFISKPIQKDTFTELLYESLNIS